MFEDVGLLPIIAFLVLIIIIAIIVVPKVVGFVHILPGIVSSTGGLYGSGSSTVNQGTTSINSTIAYALELTNKYRNENGLPNVTLSHEGSAQQHASSMLQYSYFSHWDIYGMKPYMRYTLLGGRDAVEENIAYTKSGVEACVGTICKSYGNLNTTNVINSMLYNMMYNDSQCCNNGHKDNILDPNHNQVAIGIAYNSTTMYMVQDFIDNYTSWLNNTPSYTNDKIYLEGSTASNYIVSSVVVSYDNPLIPLTAEQLDQTSEYSYGQSVAGVVSNIIDYYPSLVTVVANTYNVKGSNFFIVFNMSKLITRYGPGEYTVEVWLNSTASKSSFVGSTYTIFVNSSDSVYTPSKV